MLYNRVQCDVIVRHIPNNFCPTLTLLSVEMNLIYSIFTDVRNQLRLPSLLMHHSKADSIVPPPVIHIRTKHRNKEGMWFRRPSCHRLSTAATPNGVETGERDFVVQGSPIK